MTHAATATFSFCAGHRLKDHESKCAHLHGHNWTVEVTVVRDGPLDHCGRVLDFSTMRAQLKGWVDQYLDHGMILDSTDLAAIEAVQSTGGKLYVMHGPPSAENVAQLLLTVAQSLMEVGPCKVACVQVAESSGGRATCTA